MLRNLTATLPIARRYGATTRFMATEKTSAASGGSSITQRFTAFCVGVAGASAFYYVQLHQDIWDSTVKIEKSLSDLKLDAVQETASLRYRVAVLEKEVAKLKAKA
jgi:cell division protein FtsB